MKWADLLIAGMHPLKSFYTSELLVRAWESKVAVETALMPGIHRTASCPIFVDIFRTSSKPGSVRNVSTSFGHAGVSPRAQAEKGAQDLAGSVPTGSYAGVSNQVRKSSLTPSQIHAATPSSFTAMSCQFHFEHALRTP